MSVISRVMWAADDAGLKHSDLLAAARRSIAPWAMEDDDAELPSGGAQTFERRGNNPGLRTVTVREVEKPCGLLVEVEDDDCQGAVWGVQIRLAFVDDKVHAWIDNTLESETVAAPVSVGRPRVVDDLLAVGEKPRLGASVIQSDPAETSAAAVSVLHDLLADPERRLPVVVVTCPRAGFDDRGILRATSLAKRLTGLATVVTLGPAAQDALKAALPDRLAVWGGAVRVYAPSSVESPTAHRLYSGELLRQRGIDPVVNWVTAMSSRRRPVHSLRLVDQAGRASQPGTESSDIEELRLERDIAQEELEKVILDHAEVEAELSKAHELLRRLRRLGFEAGRGDEVQQVEIETESADEVPMSVSGAVVRAREELAEFLSLPEGAERDLDRVDSAVNASSWGVTTWRGLNALAEYSRDVRTGTSSGGFWNWCASGGSWPATDKKLSMTESESVDNRAKFWRKRMFGVDREVDATGTLYMGAHLKISEGGGNLAPRVYFHDDTAGATKRVHVGFVGPHYLVPNTKS